MTTTSDGNADKFYLVVFREHPRAITQTMVVEAPTWEAVEDHMTDRHSLEVEILAIADCGYQRPTIVRESGMQIGVSPHTRAHVASFDQGY